MSQQRYYVDQRSGCIAVCDRIKYEACVKEFGPMPGLHGNDQHVVEYWAGSPKASKCPTCGHVRSEGWELSAESITAAHLLCDELNAKELS